MFVPVSVLGISSIAHTIGSKKGELGTVPGFETSPRVTMPPATQSHLPSSQNTATNWLLNIQVPTTWGHLIKITTDKVVSVLQLYVMDLSNGTRGSSEVVMIALLLLY